MLLGSLLDRCLGCAYFKPRRSQFARILSICFHALDLLHALQDHCFSSTSSIPLAYSFRQHLSCSLRLPSMILTLFLEEKQEPSKTVKNRQGSLVGAEQSLNIYHVSFILCFLAVVLHLIPTLPLVSIFSRLSSQLHLHLHLHLLSSHLHRHLHQHLASLLPIAPLLSSFTELYPITFIRLESRISTVQFGLS